MTPTSTRSWLALGLMSGTSADGIDAALLRTDGVRIQEQGPTLGKELPDSLRQGLLDLMRDVGDRQSLEEEFTRKNAKVVQSLLEQAGLEASEVDLIGFHGQTLRHHPESGWTDQLGDGALLARLTRIPVINEFRLNDMKHGGQGAPFAPLYHQALAESLPKPLVVLNLGGVGNVTWLGTSGAILAFDTGPANALMDDVMQSRVGERYDRDGAQASKGTVDGSLLKRWMQHPYFTAPAPKSLDRNQFEVSEVSTLSTADALATLLEFTVESVAAANVLFPEAPQGWVVTGGGRRNAWLMKRLQERLQVSVQPVESVQWSGDDLEAQAFAFLAVRSHLGLPLSLPETTGVAQPVSGGRLHRP
jgi:anhydro-N-acetylmuramic acid kinase